MTQESLRRANEIQREINNINGIFKEDELDFEKVTSVSVEFKESFLTKRWDKESLPQIIKDAIKAYMENKASENEKIIDQLTKEFEAL